MALVLLLGLLAGQVHAAIYPDPHSFYGDLTINGSPAPIGTEVKVTGDNVLTGIEGNPLVTTIEAGKYGGPGAFDPTVVAQGDIAHATTLTFYVNGVSTGTTYSWASGAVTKVDLSPTGMKTIASYSDSGHNTACETFDDYSTEHIAYMYGGNYTASHSYKIAYYDGDNDRRAVESETSDGSGNLSSQHTFVAGTDASGTWHVVVYEGSGVSDPPSTWSATGMASWGNTLSSDTFTVQESAIPEFPTVMVGIVSISLCAGIYLWLRRKRAPTAA